MLSRSLSLGLFLILLAQFCVAQTQNVDPPDLTKDPTLYVVGYAKHYSRRVTARFSEGEGRMA
jgi:hypothetical protein